MRNNHTSYAPPVGGRLDSPDFKLTLSGQIRAEPLRNGSWLTPIGRDHAGKRFRLTRAKPVELVRTLTPAELQP